MSDRRPGSERARLDPFVAVPDDAISPRDQRDLMSQPFFSLAKGRRTAPILYETGGIRVEVHGFPDYGMATIWDADVLIWAASQIVAAADRGLKTSRFFRFTPYQLLVAIGRGPGQSQYVRLKRALQRLQSTVVLTTIRHGANWRRMQFSWINEWEELVDVRGHCHGMELVLPEWFYRGVLDRSLVLTMDPAYFALTGGIERWLYRIARRHAGHEPQGWAFELRHLYTNQAARPTSRILRSISAGSLAVSPCPVTTCRSSSTTGASCCGSLPANCPPALWTVVWNLSADQAHAVSADQGNTIRPSGARTAAKSLAYSARRPR